MVRREDLQASTPSAEPVAGGDSIRFLCA